MHAVLVNSRDIVMAKSAIYGSQWNRMRQLCPRQVRVTIDTFEGAVNRGLKAGQIETDTLTRAL